MSESVRITSATIRDITSGDGWKVCDEVCCAGRMTPAFEERHAQFSVCAVLSGTFTYRSSLGRALMSPGSLLLGQEGKSFCCTHEHSVGDRCVAFYLAAALFEELAREIPGVRRTAFAIHRVPPLQELVGLLSDVRALAENEITIAGEELMLRMAGAALCLGCHGQQEPVHKRDEQRIAHALTIIAEKLSTRLTVALLAREVGMSRYHFLRTFHRVAGESPYRYILGRRLDLASRRLRATPGRVLDVALDCGFGDLSEFTRTFTKRFGVPPATYRKRARALPAL